MTDKQIIIEGVDVHWCEHYTGNIGYLTDKNWTCRAKIQGTKCEDWSNCYFKRWQRKEQECEELKEIINEAQNSKLDLKSFLVGEAIQNEYEQQLDQLKEQIKYQNNFIESLLKATNNSEWLDKSILDDEAGEIIEKIELDYTQLEAYKMEADEGKEINAELKAENEEWKKANDCILTTLNVIAEGNKKLRQTLTEIKEIAITGLEGFCPKCSRKECEDNNCIETAIRDILQKISECEVK